MSNEQEESSSDRDVRVEVVELQISICSSYVILAKRATDPVQARSFRSKARAAFEEAKSLSQRLPEAQGASFKEQVQSMHDRLLELDAILNAGT